MSLLVLSAQDTFRATSTFTPDELVALMAAVFSCLSGSTAAQEIVQPHRTTVPTAHHTALFMPSRIASMGTAMKVVSVPTPGAPVEVKARGLPASTVVLDERTGAVRAIVNARLLTALRNAAGKCVVLPMNREVKTRWSRVERIAKAPEARFLPDPTS